MNQQSDVQGYKEQM